MEKIKCVVWDLDNTIWDGTLSEGDQVRLNPIVRQVMQTLDERGVLQSVASKNDYDLAWGKLQEFGIEHFFIYPQIHWNSKAGSIEQIAKDINIGLDTFAFIDDQAFEREEVSYHQPDIRTYDALEVSLEFLKREEFIPRFITEDSTRRRAMYQSDVRRKTVEEGFDGTNDAFLATLDMVFSIKPAEAGDLERAEELTLRTNQLNTTGETYSYEELDAFRQSPDHKLLVAELNDKFGGYGKIGLVLLELQEDVWHIRLLLMSCRVMARGVGGAMITFIRNEAAKRGVRLLANFKETDRNRMMYITYKFAGFNEIGETDGVVHLENDLSSIPLYSSYLKLDFHF